MPEVSTKPYLIRAIHEWCSDSGYTPYIAVVADDNVNVPREFVKNGEIVLNISPLATNRLSLGNEFIEFQARFGGQAREVSVPIDKVIAIYARENGQGMGGAGPGRRAGRACPGRQTRRAHGPGRRPRRTADAATARRPAEAHPRQVTFSPRAPSPGAHRRPAPA
jgi:stringent starvation protein B